MLFLASLVLCALLVHAFKEPEDPHRPQYHYTPAKGWINDPNGLIRHNGKYHLFYQHNPNGPYFDKISWGHATSWDLNRWKEHPVALHSESDAKGATIMSPYSGNIVYDEARTSDFSDGSNKRPLVAIYTAAYEKAVTAGDGRTIPAGAQTQSLAYSFDDGETWTKYGGNPVILEPPAHYSDQFKNFRDPSVFWYSPESGPQGSTKGHWVMVVALSTLRKVLMFKSDNLKDWTWVSEVGPLNAVEGVWECPNLFSLPVRTGTLEETWSQWLHSYFPWFGQKEHLKWVLTVGLNPGGPANGSGTQYFIGDFDGESFIPDADSLMTPAATDETMKFESSADAMPIGVGNNTDSSQSSENVTQPEKLIPVVNEKANWMDFGPDFYAWASWNGLSRLERIGLAWMNNWLYAAETPPYSYPWRGAMTLPRILGLREIGGKLRLVQAPAGLKRSKTLKYEEHWDSIESSNSVLFILGKTLDITLTFSTSGNASRIGTWVRVVRSAGIGTFFGYDFTTSQMILERSYSGLGKFADGFATAYVAPLQASEDDGMVKIRALVDWSSIELFGGQGETTMTAQIFPIHVAEGTTLLVEGGTARNVTLIARDVLSPWQKM